jgi:hypothetical protein
MAHVAVNDLVESKHSQTHGSTITSPPKTLRDPPSEVIEQIIDGVLIQILPFTQADDN